MTLTPDAQQPPLLTYMSTDNALVRAAAFLRTYATRVRDGSAFTWEIPNTVASTLEDIATKLDALHQEQEQLRQENEQLRAEHTRAVLRYTAKGYMAGENADSKHWRQHAEKAESEVTRLAAILDQVRRLPRQWHELEKRADAANSKNRTWDASLAIKQCADELTARLTKQ